MLLLLTTHFYIILVKIKDNQRGILQENFETYRLRIQ
uniref:Uncharacterized protein n=1 Tax=Rhizophora mucronata TaxID=61149 RepID=A0A2P2QNC3_RHIMU